MAKKVKLESTFQSKLISDIETMFPDAVVLKVEHYPGKPDIVMLKDNRWAALECKREQGAHVQPNQPYWVDRLNYMSFARFVCPENKKEVLHELQSAFQV